MSELFRNLLRDPQSYIDGDYIAGHAFSREQIEAVHLAGLRKRFDELRRQVPVVPVVSHGGHSSVLILTRGEWIGDVLRTARIRTRAFPLALQVPWGLSPLMIPGIPLPAKITTEIGPAPLFVRYAPNLS